MQWTSRDEPAPMADINTTPLIDVLLVLLITLIVTIPPMTHAVKLELNGSVSNTPREIVTVDIDADGSLYWNGEAVADYQQFERLCLSAAQRQVQHIVRVRSDRRAKYDSSAKVLSIAQRSGIQALGLIGNQDL